jgi:hypothetical protein
MSVQYYYCRYSPLTPILSALASLTVQSDGRISVITAHPVNPTERAASCGSDSTLLLVAL